MNEMVVRWDWLNNFEIGILIDEVSLLMIALVLFVSSMVILFSIEYMKEDQGRKRYYAYLTLFILSMIGILVSDHLILLFVFWELVGLSSYLLIGFWYRKSEIPASARTAFMVNRVADVALLAGIFVLYKQSGNLFISELHGKASITATVLIAIGAFGKSAQFPFSGWLTKAMVGPTPVSALIHAATMVAAGVYLLFRMAPFLPAETLNLIAIVGTTTALYGAFCAIYQHDIKKILAYSTISQLGYMMIGIGVGAQNASIFHLFTHAFFKAGLFLGAASIIHYLHTQDIREMGGLKNRLPWTYRSMLVCGLALAGLPFFSGFLSKDGIILAAWTWANELGTWAYLVPDIALITALVTAFYVGRMLWLVYLGESRMDAELKNFIESKWIKITLVTLSLLSFWIAFNWNPLAHDSWILGWMGLEVVSASPFSSGMVTILSTLLVLAGLVLSYSYFKPGTQYVQVYKQLGTPGSLGGRLLFNGFYLTNSYKIIGTLFYKLSEIVRRIDEKILDPIINFVGVGSVVVSKVLALVDRFVVDGPVNLSAFTSAAIGKRLAGLSSRDSQTQLIWLLLIVILILCWIVLF